jgi:HEAT repeat protein
MQTARWIATALVLAGALSLSAQEAEDAKCKALLEKITSRNEDVRFAARADAAAVGAPAVAALVELLDEARKPPSPDAAAQELRHEVAITARAALERLVHHAGRPGADAEREAVAAELAKALAPGQTLKTKREVLRLVGFVGGDAQVDAVAKLLEDPDANVRETARLTLERMPGGVSVAALLEAARRLGDERKPDLLFSVGKKGDPGAAKALVELAGKSTGTVRLGALRALAHLGTPEGLPAFAKAVEDREAPERAQIFTEHLRLADNLQGAGKTEEARSIYFAALRGAPLEHQRERALLRVATGPGEMESLLLGLTDSGERVRGAALGRLSALQGPEVLGALLRAYGAAKPEGKAAILRVIAGRDEAKAAPLLAEAARSQDLDLKLTALDIQGQLESPELEGTYLKAAQGGSAQIRPVALKGYLLVARKRLAGGDAAKALEMFGQTLGLATAAEQRGEALQGIIAAGLPKGIEYLVTVVKDPALGNDAAKGIVALAAKVATAGDKDAAEKHLMGVLTGDYPREIRAQAAEELRKMGRDPQQSVRTQGFVVDWWVVTPIQDPDGNGLEKKHFPEDVIDLAKEQRFEGRRFRWQKLGDVSLDGRIDLTTSFRRSEKVLTYAYTEVSSPKAQEVLFKMGSDDGIACWLNGQRIHLNNAARSLKLDEDSVKASLAAGTNKILLKINNLGGDWAFVFRVTDLDGKPMELAPPGK